MSPPNERRVVTYPERTPPYRRVHRDRLGRIWIESYQVSDEGTRRYSVMEADGTVREAYTLNSSFEFLDADANSILVSTTDPSGVPQVALLPRVCT